MLDDLTGRIMNCLTACIFAANRAQLLNAAEHYVLLSDSCMQADFSTGLDGL